MGDGRTRDEPRWMRSNLVRLVQPTETGLEHLSDADLAYQMETLVLGSLEDRHEEALVVEAIERLRQRGARLATAQEVIADLVTRLAELEAGGPVYPGVCVLDDEADR